MRWQGTGYYPGDAVCIGPPDRMISWVVCNHQCCVYLAVDAMEFLTGSSDRRDNEAGPVASASNLTAYRVHACQKVSVQSRCLSVGDGSNGMWRGGSGVLASLEPIGIRKASVDELHAQLIILHTNFLDSGIASSRGKQACSEHAYRGGKAAFQHIASTGYTAE
jgi:hypothetical protein